MARLTATGTARRPFQAVSLGVALLGAASVLGCGGSSTATQANEKGFASMTGKVKATRNADGSINDGSRCDWRGKVDREASETAGPGSIQPNVRRVWQIVGTGDDRHKVLVCREIDTNFDGVKDVVRKYNDKGESLHEEADANYDGKIDTWITFSKGRLAEVRIDNNSDGNPDEWKYYSGGKLARVKRDQNRDGKPDIWEMYREGKLERMGVDVDGNQQVDRWDHDTELRRVTDEAERKKEEEAAAAEAKKQAAQQAAFAAEAQEQAADPKKKKVPATKKQAPPAGSQPAPAQPAPK
jgi:hypothetical protein